MAELTSQVAVVTGAGRGIGRDTAVALARAGAAVAVVARTLDQVQQTQQKIANEGGRALALTADVTDFASVSRAIEDAERGLGPIDLVVNNAGTMCSAGPLWEADVGEWWRDHQTNVQGTFHVCRAAIPGMLSRRRGRIINVASLASVMAAPNDSAYFTSKTGLLRLSEILALELKATGVFVFAIHPGAVRTRLLEGFFGSPGGAKFFPGVLDRQVAQGRVEPNGERAGKLCVTLASGAADALSGRFLTIDDNLPALIEKAEQIAKRNLYTLNLRVT